jgi:hypothetical protein
MKSEIKKTMDRHTRAKRLAVLQWRAFPSDRALWMLANGGSKLFYQLFILLRTQFWIASEEDFAAAMKRKKECSPLDPSENCETCCGTFNECNCNCGIIGEWCGCKDTSFEGVALTCCCEKGASCDRFCGTEARWNNRDRSQNARSAIYLTKALISLLFKYRLYLSGAHGSMARLGLRVVEAHCEKLELCGAALKKDALDASRDYLGLAKKLLLFYCGIRSNR